MNRTSTSRRSFLRVLASAGASASLLGRAEELTALDPSTPVHTSRVRDQYMLAPDLVYLNHASIGTVPRSVHRAHAAYLELCESFPSLYVWGAVWREVTEETRGAAAALLNCATDDLAITHNTTEGFNVLAHGLPIGEGDEVLFSSLNHPGASVAWRGVAARRGYAVRDFTFPIERAPELTVDEVVELHAAAVRPQTKVLVLPHVDNMVGMRHPLREIARAVRAQGVEFVVVDGAQSAGMIPVDLSSSGVDAYAMSPHKWIQSPKGLGLFWVNAETRGVLPRMWYRTGGERIRGSARKYEDYSTRAWPGVVALGDALDFQASIGAAEKARRYASLWTQLKGACDADSRLTWKSPTDEALTSVLMAVEVRGAQASNLVAPLLDRGGIVVRGFGAPLNALRVSPNVATSGDDLETFVDGAVSHAG